MEDAHQELEAAADSSSVETTIELTPEQQEQQDAMDSDKALRIYQSDVNYTLYEIRWEGGGQVPAVLKGQFTSPSLAQKKIHWFDSTLRGKKLVPAAVINQPKVGHRLEA
jgi:hypothetical protein